jgi:hypothetical protein
MLLLFWIFCQWLEVSELPEQERGKQTGKDMDGHVGMSLTRIMSADYGHPGHLLVTTRQHKVKVADMGAVESREIGTYPSLVPPIFSPYLLLAKVSGSPSSPAQSPWSLESPTTTLCKTTAHELRKWFRMCIFTLSLGRRLCRRLRIRVGRCLGGARGMIWMRMKGGRWRGR